jgi:isopentenyldiphosphate isomerase
MPAAVEQNDPTEILEVFDAKGRPTGLGKSRAAIHLDGDWHQAFHCWILRRGGREVVLQRRSLAKDTFAGCWDAAAAGHWRFGESPAEASREIAEELGLDISFASLTYRGRERASRRFSNGLVDREFHQVYVLALDEPLSAYRPDAAEVIGLGVFAARQLVDLATGGLTGVAAVEAVSVADDGRVVPARVVLERGDVVPYSAARLRRMLGAPNSR